jgi:hypothetical protein
MLKKARIVSRRAVLLPLMLLVAVLHTAVASAQEPTGSPMSSGGLWIGASLVINQPWASEQLARGWERVGQLGLGSGIAVSAGYDASQFGFGLELESTSTHLGDRPGRNLAAAALLRVRSPWQPSRSWPAHISAGYVRFGLGGAYVLPSELPMGYFHTEPSPLAGGERLILLGNGVRLGVDAKHALSTRTAISIGLGGDVVQFGSATYQHTDQTLTSSGWAVIPRLAVGFAVTRGHHR